MRGHGVRRYSRWFGAYLLLAAFVILTVSGSLLIHHRSVSSFRNSVEIDRLWAREIENYQRLEASIAAANAPGNDVFASADPVKEAARLSAAIAAYQARMADVRAVAAATAGLTPDRDWPSILDEVDSLMAEMSSVTEEILALFGAGQISEAASRMAAMDRLYGEVDLIVNLLQTDTRQRQRSTLETQLDLAEEMRTAEYMVGGLVALMVLALSIYGYRLSRRMTETEQERNAQLDAIEVSERKFRELAEGSIEGITVHRHGKPLFVNQTWAEFHNYEDPDEVVAVGDLSNIVAEEDREAVSHIRYSLQHGPGISRRYEYRAMRTDGSIIWLECLERVILWQDRPAIQTTAIDITERKLAEEKLKAAKLDAEQASNARTRFLAAASHDLRQPLQAITLYLPLLAKRIGDPDTLATVEAIKASSESMRSLLDSLLDISKLDAGMVEANIGPVPVLDIFDQLAVEAAPQAAQKSIQLRFVPSTLWVKSDPTLLQDILRNFLSNALRYTHTGRILVGARQHGDRVRIEVWDTGPGIPDDQQTRIFEEFYQADHPARNGNTGIGLGLAIIERLARLLNHGISVHSQTGKGSVFGVEMAISEPPTIDIEAAAPCKFSVDMSAVTALLIDDNSGVRAATTAALADWGCTVLAAATIEEALALIADDTPDVILTDLTLRKDETGVDAVRRIRRTADRPVPALIITAETNPERLRDVINRNMMILHKPIEPDTLRLALEGLVLNRGDNGADSKAGVAAPHSMTESLT